LIKLSQILVLLFTVLLFSCAGCGGGSSSKNVTVSWSANNDKVVNTSGGGYTLYYSKQSGFDTSSADTTDVPYVSGTAAPTSAILLLSEGVWYIRVAAYGLLNGVSKSSDPSAQISVNVEG